MTNAEASELAEDLQQIPHLRDNRVWKRHILPEIERMKAEHATEMHNLKLPQAERCEHLTAHKDAEQLLAFIDKIENQLREKLREHDRRTPVIERAFHLP
jgi:ribosome-associated translation inhibitor RaiA